MMSKNIQGFLDSQRLSNSPAYSHCDVQLKRFKMTAGLPVRDFKIKLKTACPKTLQLGDVFRHRIQQIKLATNVYLVVAL